MYCDGTRLEEPESDFHAAWHWRRESLSSHCYCFQKFLGQGWWKRFFFMFSLFFNFSYFQIKSTNPGRISSVGWWISTTWRGLWSSLRERIFSNRKLSVGRFILLFLKIRFVFFRMQPPVSWSMRKSKWWAVWAWRWSSTTSCPPSSPLHSAARKPPSIWSRYSQLVFFRFRNIFLSLKIQERPSSAESGTWMRRRKTSS